MQNDISAFKYYEPESMLLIPIQQFYLSSITQVCLTLT